MSKKTTEKHSLAKPAKKHEFYEVVEDNAISVELDLTESELMSKGQELVQQMEVKDQLQADLKKLNAEKKGEMAVVDKKIEEIQRIISTGKKKSVVQATKLRDFFNAKVLFVKTGSDLNALKPSDIYKTEPFTEWDYQLKINLESGNDSKKKNLNEDAFFGKGDLEDIEMTSIE